MKIPYIENYVQQTLGSRLKFTFWEKLYIYIFASLILCLFNLEIFAKTSFQCKSPHASFIKNIRLSQNAGVPLMLFKNTNHFSEATKVTTVFLKSLLNNHAVTFEEDNLFITIFFLLFRFNCFKTN